MAIINLRDYYPHSYSHTYTIEVSDTVAEAMEDFRRQDSTQRRKACRHDAGVPLDLQKNQDSFLFKATYCCTSPEEAAEIAYTREAVCRAIAKLPPKQGQRLIAYFFQERTFSEIAVSEGVTVQCVWQSIQRGLQNLKKLLQHSIPGV